MNNSFYLLEKARLSEWIGDATDARSIYNKALDLNTSVEFKKFIEPIIKERKDKLEEIEDPTNNEMVFQEDKMNFRYSVRIIEKIQSQLYLQIRGFDQNMRDWDITPLSNDTLNQLSITQQFPNPQANKVNYEYQEDILTLYRIVDEMHWYSLTLDKNGIIFGDAVIDEKEIGQAIKYIRHVLKLLEDTFQ